MNSDAGHCRTRSACSRSSKTTSGARPDRGRRRPTDRAALQFLLQTLATLDVATRGFLDGTKRYEQQRARADDLADRDEFRTALVNSLQEGFFVADRGGAIIEVNDAFADITGYGARGLPYPWPYPWVVDEQAASQRLSRLVTDGHAQSETTDPAPRRPPRVGGGEHQRGHRPTATNAAPTSARFATSPPTRAVAARESAVAAPGHRGRCRQERRRSAVDHARRVPARRSTLSASSP